MELTALKQRTEAWWTGRNTGPILYMIFPDKPIDYAKLRRPWMSAASLDVWTNWKQEVVFGHAVELTHATGNWQYVEDALDLLAVYPQYTGHAAEGFSFNMPMMGPGSLSAYVSGFAKFHPPTIWLELPEPWPWECVLALTEHSRDRYWDTAVEAVRRHVARLQPQYVIAQPDHGGILDVLASLVSPPELLMKMVEAPDEVLRVIAVLEKLWYKADAEFGAIIDPGNHGCYARQMRWLSTKPTITGVCDLCAMIGPAMFEQFVLPSLRRDCEHFPHRMIYHLDGPGQLPHVDHLLSLDKLHAIQWVEGAGNPNATDPRWHDFYRRVIDAGKRLCISLPKERVPDLQRLFTKFPAEAFWVQFMPANRTEAGKILHTLRPE